MKTRTLILVVIVLAGTLGSLHAQAPQHAAITLDPLDDGAWLGAHDDLNIDMILAEGTFEQRRQVLWVVDDEAEPERFLPSLAALMAGDDPSLAPSAASALWQICADLELDGIQARESGLPDGTVTAIQVVIDDESVRPDIRSVAAACVLRFEAWDEQPSAEP